ncbi:MAG: HAMP domain-containing protein [Herpetosiphonaceae bacterium]|nr:HAMP domain-containing protein [Herpetosiphonaceae bacterium]
MKTTGRRILLMLVTVGCAIAKSVLIGWLVLGIPASELGDIAQLFAVLGLIAGVLALLVVQTRVLNRLGSLRTQIIVIVTLGGAMVAGLLQGAAQAMFINTSHDLPLLLLMLVFMLVLALGFSVALGNIIVGRVGAVRAGAGRLASGDLAVRLPITGRDELTALAGDFNRMADALAQAAMRQRELEHARRELVAAVSHDLRTPLTAVRAMVEALADGVVQDPPTRQRYLEAACAQLENLSTLVDDLFEIAQIDAGVLQIELERASLHDLISDTLSNLQPHAAKHGVRLIGEVAANVDLVLMSPPKMQRVLYNLIGNALRHTPADGTITLRATAAGDEVQVEIDDEGEGISADDLPHIFEHSYRGEKSRSRDYGGAGLGLAIVRGLVEAHGGRIWVESKPEAGTRFVFTLSSKVAGSFENN